MNTGGGGSTSARNYHVIHSAEHRIRKISGAEHSIVESRGNAAAVMGVSINDDSSSCFCTYNLWYQRRTLIRPSISFKKREDKDKIYTNTDLARELNSLSMKEREEVEEDIHGVSEEIPEPPDFVEAKIQEMRRCLGNMPKGSTARSAWDRAAFLRPSLPSDRDHALLFLRARRFDAFAAATLLLKFYEAKRELWGDDLLIHKITWNDLSPLEQSYVKSGFYQLISGREVAGRGIGYNRIGFWDVHTDPWALFRADIYIYMSAFFDNPNMQRKGLVSVFDLRGEWKSSILQMVQHMARVGPIVDSLPHHLVATHMLYDQPNLDTFIQDTRGYLRKGSRVRSRVHYGSTMEICYTLRTFGMNIGDCLVRDSTEGPLSEQGLKEEINRRRQIEDKWRDSEAPYRNPASSIALYPNPQDIIMGRNKTVAPTWPGNVNYNKLIEQHAPRFLEAGSQRAKAAIAEEIVEMIQTHHGGRFLIRREAHWETAPDTEAHSKTKQALRNEARTLLKEMKKTLEVLL